MKVTPIKQYSQPAFPTRSVLDDRPELLRLIPKRWQKNPVVLTALAGVAALACGTRGAAADMPPSDPAGGSHLVKRSGTPGWVVVKYVIPSEEDARQVINEEAKRAGLNFQPDIRKLNILSSKRGIAVGKIPASSGVVMTFDGVMDGVDPRHDVSYEYVSEADLKMWQSDPKTKWFSDVEGTAKELGSLLRTTRSAGYSRAFWASRRVPAEYYDHYYADATGNFDAKATETYREDIEKKTMENALEDLRAQVRDFITWLKAEGVI